MRRYEIRMVPGEKGVLIEALGKEEGQEKE